MLHKLNTAVYIAALTILAGCVIVVKTDPPVNNNITGVKQPAQYIPKIEIITPKINPTDDNKKEQEQVVVYMQTCDEFILPKQTKKPSPPDLSKPEYETFHDVERALVIYIKALQSHIDKERKILEIAHKQHITNCRDK